MDAERNLLFGVLALQADVITQAQFVQACRLWSTRKETPFAELLRDNGSMAADDKGHIEYLLDRKLNKHGGEARDALAEVWATWLTWAHFAGTDVRDQLLAVGDADIQKALGLKDPPVLLTSTPNKGGKPVAWVAALLALTALALAGGLVWLWHAHDAIRQQRDRANENFVAAHQAIDAFATRLIESVDAPREGDLRKALLQSALRYYEAFVERRGDDPALRRQVADSYLRLAGISREVGSPADAEKALSKAAELFEALHHETPGDRDLQVDLARADLALAEARIAGNQASAGGEAAGKAVALLEPLWHAQRDVSEYARLLARGYELAGDAHAARGEHAQGVPSFQKAIAVLEQAIDAHPADLEAKKLLARTHQHLAAIFHQTGAWSDEENSLRHGIALYEQLVETNPGHRGFRVELGRGLGHLGRSQVGLGRFAAAQKDLKKCLDLLQKLVEQEPGVSEHRALLADVAAQLGDARRAHGNTAEAERFYRQALALFDELKEPESDARLQQRARLLFQLGTMEAERDRTEAGITLCEQAQSIQEKLVKRHPKHLDHQVEASVTRERLLLLRLLLLRSDVDEGKPADHVEEQTELVREREKLVESVPDNTYWQLAVAGGYVRLAKSQRRAGQPGSAVASAGKAVELLEKIQKARPEDYESRRLLAEALAERSRVKWRLGAAEDARKQARQAIELVEKLAWEEPAYWYDVARHRTWLAFTLGLGRQAARPEDGMEAERLAVAAIKNLHQAIRNGFDNRYKLETDEDFEPLRERPEFSKLFDEIKPKSDS